MHYQKQLLTGLIFVLFFVLVLSGVNAQDLSETEKSLAINGGLIEYYWLGTSHMLKGYDHLLFIFGVVFFLNSFLDVVKYITGFTLGHTATLIIATYNGIQFNYFLIDAFIALTVVYIAFVNMQGFEKHLKLRPPNLLIMVTTVGLIHGLGLSTRLQELPLKSDNLFSQIISFNVGVEAGQLMALAAMLLLIRIFKHNNLHTRISSVVNFVLGFFGFMLFLLQIHGYLHSQESIKNEHASHQNKNTVIVLQKSDIQNSLSQIT